MPGRVPCALALAAVLAGCAGMELTSPFHGSIKVPGRDRAAPPTEADAEAAEWGRTAAAMKALAACRERAVFLDLDPRYCCFERDLPMRFCANGEAAAPHPYGDARTSHATRDPGAAVPTLRDTIKAAEGVTYEPRNGHICHGHWILDHESFGRMTVAQCDDLLDRDIAQARREALRVFGRADDARAELCYWKPCARMFGHVDPGDLAGAVATSERLLSIDPARTRRIAAAL